MSLARHLRGRPYRRARLAMFAIYGDTCWICGHPGARQADHLKELVNHPHQEPDPRLMRPSHGGGRPDNPCPTCGRRCNQERGATPADQVREPLRTSQAW